MLALSADHGVAAIPEQLKAEGQDAGRVKMAEIMTLVDSFVSKKFGKGRWVGIGLQPSSIPAPASTTASRPTPLLAEVDTSDRIAAGRAQGV